MVLPVGCVLGSSLPTHGRSKTMSHLIRIAHWTGGVSARVVFVHGIGGDADETWRAGTNGEALWPTWLAEDVPGLDTYTLSYDAPVTNWLGTSMPLQDRVTNVLEWLLTLEPRDTPVAFVCHSL